VPLPQSTSPSDLRSAAIVAKPTWWRSPQRVWLRRAIFQVHLWLGIVLALYCIAIGLSGAALVFHEELEQAIYGDQLQVSPAPRHISLAATVQRIQHDRPGWTVVGLRDFHASDKAALALLRPASQPATTNLRYVYFNPNDGSTLQDRMRYSGLLGWIFHLHLYLLAGRVGLTVSGWMAIGLLLLCISGIVVWWPGVTRWTRSLVLRSGVSWRRFNWDLHSVVGFWVSLALTAVTLTGIYFAFPLPVAAAVVKLTRGDLKQAVDYVVLPRALPSKPGTPVLDIDQALSVIEKHMQDAPPAEYLQIPQQTGDIYAGLSYYPTTAQYVDARRVAIDPHSGALLRSVDTRSAPLGVRIVLYFHTIHFGTFAGTGGIGLLVRALWVLIGISPALLAVTGLLMYWNRKLRPLFLRWRKS